MKNVLFGLIIASAVIAGCVKSNNKCPYTDSNFIAPTSEVQALKDSLAVHGISATQDPSGFLYTINQPGTGTGVINLCSNVSVTYKGSLFDSTVFDSTATNQVATFQLGQVIVGWQKGLPLVNKNGDITLYIPPSLGYGPNPVKDNSGNVVIPGNSFLIFNIHITDIQ